jgi:RHS repeat-associated protein
VGYTYNAAGQLATITTPSGQAIGYGYANNQITSVTVNGVPVLTNARYFPFGEVQKWTWGNGRAYERVYDADGRIKSVTLAGTVRSYGFDDASRITGLTDTQGATSTPTTIAYDNLDHLASAHGNVPGGNDLDFAYDPVGNRTSQTMTLVSSTSTGPQIRTYSYDPASNRLTAISNPAASYAYDAAGNTTSDGIFTYGYSGRNRLTTVSQAGSTIATYKHNAFGERVAKTVGGTTRLFAYDEDGHLLGEYDGTGALIQETVWLEDTPVATLRSKSGGGIDIDYVWADHLDTPRAITTSDAAATLLWSWNSDPFGTTVASGSIEYNLRFPGQYFDAETGLHYNYFRDYAASEGRYIESDPLGLDAGEDTYAYAFATPVSSFDSLGLIRLNVRYNPGWGKSQRIAAAKKIKALNQACGKGLAVVTKPIRSGKNVRDIFKKAGGAIGAGQDVDHILDLQLGGCGSCPTNLQGLDSSVNRSLGRQISNSIKQQGLSVGALITRIRIGK